MPKDIGGIGLLTSQLGNSMSHTKNKMSAMSKQSQGIHMNGDTNKLKLL
jgi:hypothetical protein